MKAIQWAGRHAWLGWLLCLPVFMQLGEWAFDRSPPFAVVGPVTALGARPGETAYFNAEVRRDLDRECSVVFSRYMIDGAGVRHDFARDPRVMTPNGLRAMDVLMAGQLRLAVEIPRGANPGPAVYATELRYTCNPIHKLWPIEVTMPLRFWILAP